jgi:CHASE2 domain
MERPSIWVLLVVLLLGILFLREPRFQHSEDIFLRWLLKYSQLPKKPVPLTVVDIGRDGNVPPLDFALFLQGVLEFKPTTIAVEPVLEWGERNKDQEQIFIDLAMRVPKLLLGAELTATPDPDAPIAEIPGFTHVTGRRGDLPAFSGIEHQPSEDVRIISAVGFTNIPDEVADDIHVPLLFQYRGEVIPSFPLQTALLYLGITPGEVKIDIGSAISLPNGTKIPVRSDGTLVINPAIAQRARHLALNELLLASQQHESGTSGTIRLDDLRNQIVLVQTTPDSNGFGAAIAAIQTNSFVRRVSWIFDCVVLAVAVAVSGMLRRFSRVDLVLGAIALSAAYCLVALALVSGWSVWLPGWLPLGAIWASVLFAVLLPKPKDSARTVAIAAPPPTP